MFSQLQGENLVDPTGQDGRDRRRLRPEEGPKDMICEVRVPKLFSIRRSVKANPGPYTFMVSVFSLVKAGCQFSRSRALLALTSAAKLASSSDTAQNTQNSLAAKFWKRRRKATACIKPQTSKSSRHVLHIIAH